MLHYVPEPSPESGTHIFLVLRAKYISTEPEIQKGEDEFSHNISKGVLWYCMESHIYSPQILYFRMYIQMKLKKQY